MLTRLLCLTTLTLTAASAQWIPENPSLSFDKLPNGILVHMQNRRAPPRSLHPLHHPLTYAPQWPPAIHPAPPSSSRLGPKPTAWDAQSDSKTIILTTSLLKLSINRQDSVLTYSNSTGHSSNRRPQENGPRHRQQ